MAFKMNTSIGKIYAKIQGTKPHAKAIATAKAPTPATGNVQGVSNPLNQGSPLQFDKKALERMNKLSDKAASKPIKKDSDQQKIDQTIFSNKPGVSSNKPVEKTLNKEKKENKKVPVKKSYKEAYKNADKSKYKDFASFETAAKKYNADKKDTSKTTREKVKSVNEISKPKPKNIDNDLKNSLKKKLSKDTKAGSDLVGKSRKETRLDRRLAKTQSKGRAIADGKGTKTPAEQRKALRLKKREGRLKKKIETKTKKGPKKDTKPTTPDFNKVDFGKYKPTGIKPKGLKIDSAKEFLKKSRTKSS